MEVLETPELNKPMNMTELICYFTEKKTISEAN